MYLGTQLQTRTYQLEVARRPSQRHCWEYKSVLTSRAAPGSTSRRQSHIALASRRWPPSSSWSLWIHGRASGASLRRCIWWSRWWRTLLFNWTDCERTERERWGFGNDGSPIHVGIYISFVVEAGEGIFYPFGLNLALYGHFSSLRQICEQLCKIRGRTVFYAKSARKIRKRKRAILARYGLYIQRRCFTFISYQTSWYHHPRAAYRLWFGQQQPF